LFRRLGGRVLLPELEGWNGGSQAWVLWEAEDLKKSGQSEVVTFSTGVLNKIRSRDWGGGAGSLLNSFSLAGRRKAWRDKENRSVLPRRGMAYRIRVKIGSAHSLVRTMKKLPVGLQHILSTSSLLFSPSERRLNSDTSQRASLCSCSRSPVSGLAQ
jgi:hypothetical protein